MGERQKNYSDHLDRLGVTVGRLDDSRLIQALPDNLDESPEIMICEKCGTQLNRFSGPDGVIWVHSRAWQRYDHEPVVKAVPRPNWYERADLICDFCGSKGRLLWKYEGDRFQQVSGSASFGHDYGTAWGSCQECSELVDAADVEGLIDRITAKSFVMRERRNDPEGMALMRDRMWDLHARLVPSFHSKTYIGPPVLPSKLSPRMMPKLRDGLHRYWTQDGLFERLIKPGFNHSAPGMHAGWDRPETEEQFQARYPDGTMPREVFDRHVNHLAVGVEAADLYWVSKDFTHLAATAGLDLKEVSIAREELPSRHGMIIWEDPIGEIPRPHGVASIRAITWTLVPEGVWLNAYIQAEDADPTVSDVAALRAAQGFFLCPNIGAGIPFVGLGGVDDDIKERGNFVLTLIATWSLMNQPGVAEQEIARPDKKQQRAASRSGRSIPDVRIISLRKRPRPARDTDADGGYELKYRRFTHGHWKMQFYGPKRGLRRRIYISPYIARPDLPERPPTTPTVKVLR